MMSIICCDCKKTVEKTGSRQLRCVYCRKIRLRYRRKITNKADQKGRRIIAKRHNLKIKFEAIFHYGGKCFCCGETVIEFLSIDHINGGGEKHRKEIGYKNIYAWLRLHNWPDGFQTACHNCNFGRHINGGICPHRKLNEVSNGRQEKEA